jgi:Tol biopolymer transport system component
MITLLAIYSTIRKFGLRVLLLITLAFHSGLASATPRNVVAGHLAASARQAAFSVQEEHSIDLVIGDFGSGSVTELRSPGTRLIFPSLSPDGDRLLVVRQHPDNGESDLLSCRTDNFHCRQLHTSKDAISSPIEIDEHRILFISSQLRTDGPNLRSKYLGFPVC